MVMSTSQQVALAFTAVLFTFVVLPRLFGVGVGSAGKENRFDSRYGRKGASPGPGAVRGQPINMNGPGSSQRAENMQQMQKLMEQELKSDKYKTNGNKGYVFTLMPLYAIGVGVFAAYKFLKIKSADDQAQKDTFTKGAKKSVEAENQLNELEQRLAQTERMLNSILTQLDPLTNCVKSVAQEQKTEIMSQLQTIRYLMKKRGMECPPLNSGEVTGADTLKESSCGRNLDDLIQSLGAASLSVEEAPAEEAKGLEELEVKAVAQDEDVKELEPEEFDGEEEEEEKDEEEEEEEEEGGEESELMPSLEEEREERQVLEVEKEEEEEEEEDVTNIEELGAGEPASGLRRRNRPE